MQFSNNEILKVVRQAIEQSIAPELKAREAQAACATVISGIDELIKRGSKTESLLADIVPKGIELAEELLILMPRPDSFDNSSLQSDLEIIKNSVSNNRAAPNLHDLEQQFSKEALLNPLH